MQLTTIVTLFTAICAANPIKRANFNGRFTLTANKAGAAFDGKELQAAGLHFFIGPSDPAAYCPVQVGAACPTATDTVLVNGAMYAEVPGGQSTFVQKSGALAFTQAHSGFQPDLYSTSTAAGADMVYRGPYGVDWAACPVASSNSTPAWQVFAMIPGFNRTDCTCFTAKAKEWTGPIGAWQYI